jgi:hypothetical protein
MTVIRSVTVRMPFMCVLVFVVVMAVPVIVYVLVFLFFRHFCIPF